MNKNSNQFHLHLFNLEIQSECTVSIKNYRTHLIESLQNIIIQQDHMYFTVQDLITHADKLWQTLDLNKVHQEIKNKRACCQHQSDQHDQSAQSDWSDQSDQSEQCSNQAERRSQDSQSTANLSQWSQSHAKSQSTRADLLTRPDWPDPKPDPTRYGAGRIKAWPTHGLGRVG